VIDCVGQDKELSINTQQKDECKGVKDIDGLDIK
jgi:hypothetical protein